MVEINRVFLIVLDSVGVGALPDAKKYQDEGANTLGHIFEKMPAGFALPNLEKLGCYKVIGVAPTIPDKDIVGCYGKLATLSPAKDTTAGHWEMAGVALDNPPPTFPHGFPKELIDIFEQKIGTKILGNCVASGTEIINRLGDEHCKTGYPIVYTSADSVFQIAAHEQIFGLERLYEISQIAREILTGKWAVGRVIARPFLGENGKYYRTQNRRDYAIDPFDVTVLDEVKEDGGNVIAIGKIEDIFNHKGITKVLHTKNNPDGMKATLETAQSKQNGDTLVFVNLVDFDMLWGHRRDLVSYANGLKAFDDYLPSLISALTDTDLLIITADHGCDPSYIAHTDHTREYVPLLVYGKAIKKDVNLGVRKSLADIAQTIADFFGLKPFKTGESFKKLII